MIAFSAESADEPLGRAVEIINTSNQAINLAPTDLRMLHRIAELATPCLASCKARRDTDPFKFHLFEASLSAGQSLRSGSRPLSAYSVRQPSPLLWTPVA
jgi:hypothetical protein